LRLTKEGFLAQCQEEEALTILLERILIRSPHGKWCGSEHFGLRDFFEDARSKPERLIEARKELNATLEELGMRYRLESIGRDGESSPGVDSMTLTFSLEGEQEPFTLKV